MPKPRPSPDLPDRGLNAAALRTAITRSLAEADALRRGGRGQEALERVAELEQRYGRTSASRDAYGTTLSLFGEHETAAEAFADARELLPRAEARRARRLVLARAEELLLLGRTGEARDAVLDAMAGATPTYGEISLLRRAIRTPADLGQLFDLLSPLFRQPDVLGRAALFQYSMACRDGGEPERAILAARTRFLHGVALVLFGSLPPKPHSDWLADAELALRDVCMDLERAGEQPFLVSGTFLGHVRDGGIIGHDKDIDLGLLTSRPAAGIAAVLARTGRFRVRPTDTDHLIQLRHANGVVIDVFLHYRDGDRLMHEGQKGRWWNTRFKLERASFLGQSVLVPDDPDRYLTENYGPDWRTPDPLFETFIDTPNLVMPPEQHMIWYYFSRLHDLHAAGRAGKIEKIWSRLRPLLGADPVVERAIAHVRAQAAAVARTAAAPPGA